MLSGMDISNISLVPDNAQPRKYANITIAISINGELLSNTIKIQSGTDKLCASYVKICDFTLQTFRFKNLTIVEKVSLQNVNIGRIT